MPEHTQKIGWIGMGRMGFPMAEMLLKAGYDVSIWNRTRSKAEPLAQAGGKIVDKPSDLAGVDVLFSIVSTGKDLEEVYFGQEGVGSANRIPPIVVDCSSIAVEESAAIRKRLAECDSTFIACPVSGNAKVIKAGKLSAVASGAEDAFRAVEPMVKVFAPRGVSYVGEGELARICKIAHNVMLGVVIENLIEITLLTNKMGADRDHAAHQQDGRAAPCLAVVLQQQRARLDVHRIQGTGPGQSRLDHDVHARTAAQGSRPRP
jgi:3-hydroxyisobutyrate dehydrogenase